MTAGPEFGDWLRQQQIAQVNEGAEALTRQSRDQIAENGVTPRPAQYLSKPISGVNLGRRPLGVPTANVLTDEQRQAVDEERRRFANKVMADRDTDPEPIPKTPGVYERWAGDGGAVSAGLMGIGGNDPSTKEFNARSQTYGDVAGSLSAAAIDPIARPAMAVLQGVDWAWENIVAEPLSAAWIATNPTSDDFGNWSAAREDANKVTFGQAVVANPLSYITPGVGLLFGLTQYSTGAPDPAHPEEVLKSHDDFLMYGLVTGLTDVGLNLAPIPGGKGLSALRRVTGMSHEVLAADHAVMADDIAQHLAYMTTGEGAPTEIGKMVEDLAKTNDVGKALTNPLIDKLSGAAKGKLAHLSTLTNDYNVTADLYLASVGDTKAAARLVQTASDLSWAQSRLGEAFKANLSNDFWMPTPEQEKLIDAAFDSAAKRSEFSRGVIDNFFSNSSIEEDMQALGGEFTVLGNWMPMRGAATSEHAITSLTNPVSKVVANVSNRGTMAAADMKAALNTGKSEYMPGFMTKLVQTSEDGPVIRLVNIPLKSLQWASAERPLNTLTFSGTRPDDVIREFYANIEQVRGLRAGESFPLASNEAVHVGEDGTIVYDHATAEALRERWVTMLTSAMASGQDSGRATMNAWRRIEDEIVTGMARMHGVPEKQIPAMISGMRRRAGRSFDSLKSKGHFYDENGHQVKFHPRVVAELQDHDYTLPLNQIEQYFVEHEGGIRKLGVEVGNGARGLFDAAGSIWRTSMLLKPGYTFRNSIMEPWISMAMAQMDMLLTPKGMEYLTKGVWNFIQNTDRRLLRATHGSVDAVRAHKATRELREMNAEYMRLAQHRDRLAGELKDFGGLDATSASIAAKKAAAQDDLNLIENHLLMLGNDLVASGVSRDHLLQFDNESFKGVSGLIDDMRDVVRKDDSKVITKLEQQLEKARAAGEDAAPLVDHLEERLHLLTEIEALKFDPMRKQQYEDLVTTLGSLNKTMKSTAKTLRLDAQPKLDEFEKARDALKALTDRMDTVKLKRAEINSRREMRARVITQGSGEHMVNINGQQVPFKEVFWGPNGEAYRAEASSGMTASQTYDPGMANNSMMGAGVNRMSRANTSLVTPDAINYADELTTLAKRRYVGDTLVQHVLTEDKKTARKWAESPRGKRYFESFGVHKKNADKYVNDNFDEVYDHVRELFPTQEARDLVLGEGNFTAGDMQKALLARLPNGNRAPLKPIIGHEIDNLMPSSDMNRVRQGLRAALESVWTYLAVQPETRMARWPYYQREFEKEWTSRMKMLADQGVELTPAVAFAQRQAARRASLQSLEKTFYNIRRYKNPVYTMRFISSFPQAFFNSIYRYMYYLPKTHPGNSLALVNTVNAAFRQIGVDDNGNHVPLSEATTLLLPGTGDPGKLNSGVRIPIDAVTRVFLDNPSRSWLMSIAMDTIVNSHPEFDQMLKDALHPDLYNFIAGEMGPRQGDFVDNMLGTMTPSWLKTALEWHRGEGSQEYRMYAAWAWEDALAQRQREGKKGPPDWEKDVAPRMRGWYITRFLTQFASPVAYKTDAPGQMERDTWRRISDQNPDLPFEDLKNKYYQAMGGDWADPYTASTTKDPYGMKGNYSLEALTAIRDNEDLARELGRKDPELVGLLTAGKARNYSKAVYNNLRIEPPYPGAEAIGERKTRADLEYDYNVNAGFDEYAASKTKYVAALKIATDAKNSAWKKSINDSWWFYLHNADPSKGELGLYERNRDFAEKLRNGKDNQTFADGFKMAIGNKKFWDEHKSDPQWQLVNEMLTHRDEIIAMAHAAKSNDYKASLKEYYTEYYNEISQDPNNVFFRDIWDRYFSDEFQSKDQ